MRNFRNWLPNWLSSPMLAVPLLTLCAGCLQSPSLPPLRTTTDLPPTPAFARPVEVANPKVQEPLELIAARERAGRRMANRVIVCSNRWYEAVRATHSKKSATQVAEECLQMRTAKSTKKKG